MSTHNSDAAGQVPVSRILVAEDEQAVRDFLVRGLAYAGYNVTARPDGREALEAIQNDPVGYDLLLTDIVMPELDGITLALKVAHDYPKMKILMMTGYAAEKQRAHNLDALSHEVISKPFSLEEILNVVHKVLG